jgi:hypothetical protein
LIALPGSHDLAVADAPLEEVMRELFTVHRAGRAQTDALADARAEAEGAPEA